MSLYRTALRSAAVSVLLGATAAEDRVYNSRTIPLGRDQVFPVIAVSTEEDSSEIHEEAPRRYMRSVTLVTALVVEAKPKEGDSLIEIEGFLAAAIDHLGYEVERAMTADPYLQDTLSKEIELKRVEVEFDADGETPRAGARITWNASYLEELPDTSEKPLVPFLHAHVEMDAEVAGSDAESEDDIHLEQ